MPPAEKELADLVGWRGTAQSELDWKIVENQLGFSVPESHKRLLSIFPSGTFSTFVHVWSPVQSDGWLKAYEWKVQAKFSFFSGAREALPEDYPHLFHPEPGGLIPWGEDDSHTYFWGAAKDLDPDDWPVVFLDNAGEDWGTRQGSTAEFLLELLSGRLVSDALYTEWPESNRSFDAAPEPIL
ncbi:SMI1/KNR4 family protein [Amycolatopsis sp. NPDC051372]|uniref:SMI1/KNR4 family protein n=1 Tax=Amycolatopsis sp. NPDC051372 TaxID=3155669 RepID=UPI00344588CA